MVQSIAVCGAGTMGSGIAQVSAQAGIPTILFDMDENALDRARTMISKSLNILVEKKKFTQGESDNILARIIFENELKNCIADVIIEAIIEKTEAKISLFNNLAKANSQNTIFATNTSSLSVTQLQRQIKNSQQVVGMHFFNPAQVMKLVEVIEGEETSPVVSHIIFELCKALGKTPVMCKDSPGFIVNRVARHYYLEAMKLVESGVAKIQDVDLLLESAGFKMGPFKLMDLIGMDINLAVSESIYNAFDHAERFKPSELQRQKVAAGTLGKKSGKGFYDYAQK